MKTQRQNVSEDESLTITRRNTRSKTSSTIDNSEPLPIDLILEIFSRLPTKSIAKCRCVRKHWASLLRRPDFTDLYLTRSSARPRLLFACQNEGDMFLFSAPQPQNPIELSSSIAASYHMNFDFSFNPYETISYVNGLVLYRHRRILEEGEKPVFVTSICNPSTGQSLILPKVKTRRKIEVKNFLGYDPIGKQYKVLSMTSVVHKTHKEVFEEHQVLTLGTEKPAWRMIECDVPHYSLDNGICINGVSYYRATDYPVGSSIIVCFDVRFEKFRVVKLVEDLSFSMFQGTLINYKGKLGLLVGQLDGLHRFKLWVLEDAEKEEWSEHSYTLPFEKSKVSRDSISFVGVTRTNEIVLTQFDQFKPPLYVVYYNIERDTMVRVKIKGIDVKRYSTLDIFLDHVEDVKLL